VSDEVKITGESGERVTIERNVYTEVVRERIGSWPKDRPSQRAWALSAVLQNKPTFKVDDHDWKALFGEAQQVVDWVQDGRVR